MIDHDREIDDLYLRARGLALVQPLLAEKGASQDDLDAHTQELQRVRERLVDLLTAA